MLVAVGTAAKCVDAEMKVFPEQRCASFDAKMWFARPGIGHSAVLWTPTGYVETAGKGPAVFFIHPTSFLARDHWNAPLDNAEANDRAALFLRGCPAAL